MFPERTEHCEEYLYLYVKCDVIVVELKWDEEGRVVVSGHRLRLRVEMTAIEVLEFEFHRT